MSSVGGFRKGEIDGNTFLIYTLLTQPDNLSSSSSGETTSVSEGDNDLLQPQFICPNLRLKAEYLKRGEDRYERSNTFIPVSISPHFPTKGSGDPQVQYLLDSDSHKRICKLPLAPLFWCNNQEPNSKEFWCYACESSAHGTTYYFCVTCGGNFHKECVDSPFEIKYPSCPFLSFQLTTYPPGYHVECFCCKAEYLVDCFCGLSYYCPTSKLNMHPVCALKPIPFEIDHPKRHPDHPLTFFPKQAYLPCNVCGLTIQTIPTYLCVSCLSDVHQFVVHQDCVDSPNVIKISRHSQHRISFTSCLPSGEWSCGVCRKEVDNNYGAYSCNKCDSYFVHTRCALRRDLWDGEELEGVPEEPEMDDPPFEVIADGIIRHFSHGHLLKLENNRVDIEDKFCSACVLPIYEGNYYLCMAPCDFILHEACANATRRKPHPLHAHLLTLKVVANGYNNNKGYFWCNGCRRRSCGFVYESNQGGQDFRLDIRCGLVYEPFEYQGHEHPLFLALTPLEQRAARCQICGPTPNGGRKLNCIECDYIICFKCATLPYKARYKHDKHFLSFWKEKETSDESGWCESCEKKIVYSREGGFYSCDDYCGTTLHVDCLLGEDTYMMRPGHTIKYYGRDIHIVGNNTMSRPFCQSKFCVVGRCPYAVFFKSENYTFCSFSCAQSRP